MSLIAKHTENNHLHLRKLISLDLVGSFGDIVGVAIVIFREGLGVGEGVGNGSEVCVGVYQASRRLWPVGQFCSEVESGLRDVLCCILAHVPENRYNNVAAKGSISRYDGYA